MKDKIKSFFGRVGNSFKTLPKRTAVALKSENAKTGYKSIGASLICIVGGLVIGLLIMILITLSSNKMSVGDAFSGIGIIISGPLTSGNVIKGIGNVLFDATPLILTGVSVAIAYKTGLFNIGAPGQFIMGSVGSLLVALSIVPSSRGFGAIMVWMFAILIGMIFAAIWGAIPGLLKAEFGINEVISCIMTNWIAAKLATIIFKYMPQIHSTEASKGAFLQKVAINYTPKLGLDKLFSGSYLDMGIFIAIIVAIIILIIFSKTTFGYELRACGFNKDASKYAGLNEKRNIVLSMAIAGAVSGLGACLYYLNPQVEYNYITASSSLPAVGFNGIASAFLANCHPVGIIFTSVFINWLSIGGLNSGSVGFSKYVADIVIAVIIYFAGFSRVSKDLINIIIKKIKDFKNKNNKELAAETNTTILETSTNETMENKDSEDAKIEEAPLEEKSAENIKPEEKPKKKKTSKKDSSSEGGK